MTAENPGSITRLIQDLKAGNQDAADEIWRIYFRRVVEVARRRLPPFPQDQQDAEDVALTAMHGLYDGAQGGRFDQLYDRDDLWRLLVAITRNKSLEQIRRNGRIKRGGEFRLIHPADGASNPLQNLVDHEPTPESRLLLQEKVQILLNAIDDPLLRQIARWRLEELSCDEIAQKLGRTVRTIERKIERIRGIWQSLLPDPGAE